MSRCFPFPPPGYVKKPAPIESIKLQKEDKNAEKEKKRKREKKEKDKSKREDRSKSDEKNKKRRIDNKPRDEKRPSTEDLERSSLTEELGCATIPPVLYDSSDGKTRDSGKGVVFPTVPAASTSPHGSGIRIRLPLVRHSSKDSELPISTDQPCFSGRTETNIFEPPRPMPSVSRHIARDAGTKLLLGESSKKKKHSDSPHRQFKKLVRDWVPPPLVSPVEENLDWLLANRRPADTCRPTPPVHCLRPGQATFAPEMEIHMLPYVVPF